MWLVLALVTFFAWGFADLFYKKGNNEEDKYSHLKTGLVVGFVMGLHATIYLCFSHANVSIVDIFKYLPVSLCYIISMLIGYKGLKYLELSVSSPIQNSSGIVTSILLCIIFKVSLSVVESIGIAVFAIGVAVLSLLEIYYDKDKKEIFRNITGWIILFPIIYCIFDGVGTFLDAVYLEHLNLISESSALLAYEYTFFIYSLGVLIFLKHKKVEIKIPKEKNKIYAAIFETLGQFTYVYAISSHSIITIPIIACYSALSVLLSRIFLKEKLTFFQYLALLIIFLGIFILGITEAL
jgi:drug/metabolite transporter (DMT)-like permease